MDYQSTQPGKINRHGGFNPENLREWPKARLEIHREPFDLKRKENRLKIHCTVEINFPFESKFIQGVLDQDCEQQLQHR